MKTQCRRPTPFHHSNTIAARLATILALTTFALSACGDSAPPAGPSQADFGIEVYVYDQDSVPVAKVPVLIDAQVVGYTDKNGSFIARILETPNTPIEISAGDIKGYRFTSDQTMQDTLTVRKGVEGFVGIPLTLRTTVQSLKNSYLTWVQLECDETLNDNACANIPLKLNGAVVAKTDAKGKAHFAFDGIMGTKSLVTIDTPVLDRESEDYVVFEPKQPSFELNLGLDSTVFVIKESFTDLISQHATEREAASSSKTTKKSRPRTATKKAVAKKAPAKKATPQKKAAPKKKAEPKSSVIDLW